MSALGQKQTFAVQNVMSALPPIADIAGCCISSSADVSLCDEFNIEAGRL